MNNQSIEIVDNDLQLKKQATFDDVSLKSERTETVRVPPSEIKERLYSFRFGFEGEERFLPYGKSISAAHGVELIEALQNLMAPFRREGDDFLTQIFSSGAICSGEQTTACPTREEVEQFGWLMYGLLNRSSAITFDKNILLKTLSQPGCEGVRFYLCKKTLSDGIHELTEENDYLSLVTVGVDKEGHDLDYVVEGELTDNSLVSEYGSPPPRGNRQTHHCSPNFIYDDKYALLKRALG
jgi:hypothetical protein